MVLNKHPFRDTISPSVEHVSGSRRRRTLPPKAKPPESDAFRGFKLGGRCRIRTYDPLIKSQLLYQLS
ncbi:protein of unknown function [Magnetospirillum gryphiswaldense MSR-1 v2]|uniref:Uncharacterized protein n=1 Tax=Magnetospirillum gryphiswaldense (strain DSM 6361 / JCM 21280 / NBRC 15271 / MSR-1) TaxID=431944 RepID=V6F2C5_MAGGM|nr:protein of unknown function [Magnetospirillum gryphiswaldense MSR-1 v2]